MKGHGLMKRLRTGNGGDGEKAALMNVLLEGSGIWLIF